MRDLLADTAGVGKGHPMARNLLTAREVQTAKEGKHSDGDGLELHVNANSASWVFRFTPPAGGRRREQGLGTCHRNNITEAGKSLTVPLLASVQEQSFLLAPVRE